MADKSLNLRLNLQPDLNVSEIKRALSVVESNLRNIGKNLNIQGIDDIANKLRNINLNIDTTDLSKLQNEFRETNTEINKTETEIEQLDDQIDKLNKKKIDIKTDTTSIPKDTTAKSGGLNIGSLAAGAAVAGGAAVAVAGLKQVIDIGVEFEASLADFSAITGVTGKDLDVFGNKARDLAKQFGGSAASQIEAFKGILSRLGPDIAKSPEALNSMAVSVNTLAKASGIDATEAMDALTTSALQFGVDLSDPIKAAKAMKDQINILAAGAKFGAAEIPQVKEAITVAGVAAKGASISFAETNSAIQTLATGGKYGAEAGTALRNVIGLLQKQSGEGDKALQGLGTSTLELGEKIRKQGLGEALKFLQSKLSTVKNETERAQITMQLFGTENSAAAGILLQNADAMGEMTSKLEGTNTAFEQADTNMKTTGASFERIKAQIQDLAINLFQSLAPAIQPLLEAITKDILPALKPVFDIIGKLVAKLIPIITKALEVVMSFVEPILDLVFNLVDALMPLVDVLLEIVGSVLKPLGIIIKTLTPVITQLVNILVAILVPILRDLSPIIEDIIMLVAELIKFWVQITMVIFEVGKAILSAVAKFLGFKNAGELVTAAIRGIIKFIGFFIGALKNLYKFINDTLKSIIKFAKGVGQLLGFIDKDTKKTKENTDKKKDQKKETEEAAKANDDLMASLGLGTDATDKNTGSTNKNTTAKEKQKKTLLELFEAQRKINENSLKELSQQKELELANKGREKNIYDEVEALKQRKAVADANLKAFTDLFKVNEKGEIGVKLKDDELEKANETLKELKSEITDVKIDEINLKAKVELSKEDFDKQIDDLTNKEVEAGLKLKILPEVEIANLESVIEKAKAELDKIKDALKEANEADAYELKQQGLKQANIIADNAKKINEARKKYDEDAFKTIDKGTDKQQELLEKRIETEERLAKRVLDNLNKAFESDIESKLNKEISDIENAENEKLKILDEKREADLISEEQYNKQKNDIIKKAEKEKTELTRKAENEKFVLEKQTDGYLLEQTRVNELARLNIAKNGLEAKLKIAKSQEERNTLTNELAKTTEDIATQSNILLAYSTELQNGITDIFSNLFAGDTEKAKDGFRGILAVAAGGLEKLASATATQFILGQLGIAGATTGFAGLVAAPLITAIVNSAISAIIRPITSSLLSFSTGGRVDSPQMALIGDAKKSGSFTNSEWIFNDKLLKMFTGSVIADYQKADFKRSNLGKYSINENGKLIEISKELKQNLSNKKDFPKISNINKIQFDGMRNLQLQTNNQLNEISNKLNDNMYNRELLRLRKIEANTEQKTNITIKSGSRRRLKPNYS